MLQVDENQEVQNEFHDRSLQLIEVQVQSLRSLHEGEFCFGKWTELDLYFGSSTSCIARAPWRSELIIDLNIII